MIVPDALSLGSSFVFPLLYRDSIMLQNSYSFEITNSKDQILCLHISPQQLQYSTRGEWNKLKCIVSVSLVCMWVLFCWFCDGISLKNLTCFVHIYLFCMLINLCLSVASLSISYCFDVLQTVYHALCIGDICRSQSQPVDIFRKVFEIFILFGGLFFQINFLF